jgi:antitoxin (DNA-binding transcriptional repressor) of toxin-antitoxin stability system
MTDNVQVAGVEEARAKLPSVLRAVHREGIVTIVTKCGVPYAAVPVSHAIRKAPKLSDLRGSAEGCFGDARRFVEGRRDEWR